MRITIVGLCGAEWNKEGLRINRKFHTGMIEYEKRLPQLMACLLPRLTPAEASMAMDLITVPANEVTYRVWTISDARVARGDRGLLEDVVRNSSLIYCTQSGPLNWRVGRLCRRYSVPYVVITEQSLQTKLDINRASPASAVHQCLRDIRTRFAYLRDRHLAARAAEVHANGYPTYLEFFKTNPNRLLFFDSRIMPSDIIPEQMLHDRLASLHAGHRGPRLIYSGRYLPMKGVLDVVRAGIELLRQRSDFRLDLFGAGPLADQMRRLVREHRAENHVFINDQVPFSPDLIQATRQCDLFISCHVQGDPSCTYLETFASGVPIVGYENEMWSRLCREANAGVVVPKGKYETLAEAAAGLLSQPDHLHKLSDNARDFACRNNMEETWNLRSARLKSLLTDQSAQGPHRLFSAF